MLKTSHYTKAEKNKAEPGRGLASKQLVVKPPAYAESDKNRGGKGHSCLTVPNQLVEYTVFILGLLVDHRLIPA